MPTWTPASAGAEREAAGTPAPDLTPLYPEAGAGEPGLSPDSADGTALAGTASVRAASPDGAAGATSGLSRAADAGQPAGQAEGAAGRAVSGPRAAWRALRPSLQQLWRHRSGRIGLILSASLLLAALLGPWLLPYSPTSRDYLALLQPPSRAHPLGTDYLGRDVLTRSCTVPGSRCWWGSSR